MTVPADGSGPTKGAALAALTVATNVVKDPEARTGVAAVGTCACVRAEPEGRVEPDLRR